MMLGCVLCSFMSTTSGSLRPGPALQWAAPGAKVFDAQMRGYTYIASCILHTETCWGCRRRGIWVSDCTHMWER